MTTAAQPALQLTPRDQALLSMVYEYGGVTTAHIRRRFFPTPGAKSPCYRRIALLIEHGYLTAVRLPATAGIGSGPSFLTIGPAGRPLLASMLGLTRTELGKIEHAFAPLFVAHHSAICDTRLAVELATQASSPAQLMEWIPERELKRQPIRVLDPKTNVTVPIVPDAALTLQLSDARAQQLYLEQDMATIAPRRMRSKVRLYLAQDAGKPRLPIILVVTTTSSRQAAIAHWVAEEAAWLKENKSISADPTRFFLTTAEQLQAGTVLHRPIWQVVGGPDHFSLIPPENEATKGTVVTEERVSPVTPLYAPAALAGR
ncbi:MAG: hypothetical protein NVSMB27_05650 [Ktedonobacteraceae bacterium]